MKKSDLYFWIMSLSAASILSFFSIFNMIVVYNLIFSICLGLFIGGIIMSVLSIILAELSIHDHGADHDQIDHIDHDTGHIDHIDHETGYPEHSFEHADHDHIEHDHFEHHDKWDHIDHLKDVTPAPFMLLFSSFLLFFGLTGILLYFFLDQSLRFLLFFITPAVSYTLTKTISMVWKKVARSRYYQISSTKNLIGMEGEVILPVDHRGGLVKIPSETPMKFERIHVKPIESDKRYKKGENIYICDFKDGFLLVSSQREKIKKYHR